MMALGGAILHLNTHSLGSATKLQLVSILLMPLRRSIIALAGQSAEQLQQEFRDIRVRFNSRYVRLYGASRLLFVFSSAC